jgi:ribonuclease VapC
MVAVLCQEDMASSVVARLDSPGAYITSPVAIYEAVLAIARAKGVALKRAAGDVQGLIDETRIEIVPVEPAVADMAILAFERYGKGRHKARLNMGDCLAYAVARSHDAAILFVGDDFSHTDLPDALRPG